MVSVVITILLEEGFRMIFIYVLILVIIIGIIEMIFHRKNRKDIPLIIHVNGTRGKSTTTRMITYGLQYCDLKVWGKTTGSEPRLIDGKGEEKEIRRRGLPKIKEQIKVIKKASHSGVDVLVLECMALTPEIQHVAGHKIVKPDYSIITNIYIDHEEIMGNTLDEIKNTIFLSVPTEGNLIICEETYNLFKPSEIPSKMTVAKVTTGLKSEQLAEKFPYPNFSENVALSLQIATELDVKMKNFTKGMLNAPPDPGITSILKFDYNDCSVYFANAFAANDKSSTARLWKQFFEKRKNRNWVAILNLRKDRQIRSKKMVEFYKNYLSNIISGLYIVGARDKSIFSIKRKNENVYFIGEKVAAQEILSYIVEKENKKSLFLFGYGNYKGEGKELIEFMNKKGEKV